MPDTPRATMEFLAARPAQSFKLLVSLQMPMKEVNFYKMAGTFGIEQPIVIACQLFQDPIVSIYR